MQVTNELLFMDLAVQKAIAALQKLGFRHAITGGLAAITYGNPRTTNDVDFVVDVSYSEKGIAERICAAFEPDFYISLTAVKEALQHKTMFQALEKENFFQVDLHISSIVPNQLERIRMQSLASGTEIPMIGPEDAILSKLVWIKMGSGKSKQDVVAMLRIQTDLDTEYLEKTALELNVHEILADMRAILLRNDPNEIY